MEPGAGKKKPPPRVFYCPLCVVIRARSMARSKSPASRKLCLASGGCKLEQNRPWLGLVDLSRNPSGTFPGGPPCLGNGGVQTPTKSTFPDVGDLAPKARKTFFTKVRSHRAHFFVYRRPQGIYADLTSKLQREQTTVSTGTPPFCFPSVVSPI